MRTGFSMKWLVWPVIAAVVALMALPTSPARADPGDQIEAIGPAAAVATGDTFDVDFEFTAAWAA
jgi:hypothetical protein